MMQTDGHKKSPILQDCISGLVVFLVALPMCLGVALASNAPLISGIVAGVIGGIVVGFLSNSSTSVSGSSPALTAVVAAQIATLGSFEALLLAIIVAGCIQIVLGLIRAGFLAAFVPSSVIKGLLAAIGVILILKQFPHLLGHDTDPEGEMSFLQPDRQNTFSEFGALLGDVHLGAAVVGLISMGILVAWNEIQVLRKSKIPAPLLVVGLGVLLQQIFQSWGGRWAIGANHRVQIPPASSIAEFTSFLSHPDFTQWANPAIYMGGLMIALVASLETLLNLEAVEKIDPQKRDASPNRELLAQGVGNIAIGLCGGIPVSSVIVRSSVNIQAGCQTKLSTIVHGCLLLFCAALIPTALNLIPLSCLAAILMMTGIKLGSPLIFRDMWRQGWQQFLPFVVTLVAIIFTDLLVGVLVGIGVSLAFILNSNLRRPMRRIVEKHLTGDVLRIELSNQVSFLNRAALDNILDEIRPGSHVLIDAQNTDYIDEDILSLIREYTDEIAPVRNIRVSLLGFRDKYQLEDQLQFVDYSTRDLQGKISSAQVVEILREGNERFRTGRRLTRDLGRQLQATAAGQHPLAVILSCIDSRTPSELIFDLGLGDIFSVRVAGNVISQKILGSIEYGTAVVGAKLIVVVGHTRCGAVTAAVKLACSTISPAEATGCQHIEHIVRDIQESVDEHVCSLVQKTTDAEQVELIDQVARLNVLNMVRRITDESDTIRKLVESDQVLVLGAMYDVTTGEIEFLAADGQPWLHLPPPTEERPALTGVT